MRFFLIILTFFISSFVYSQDPNFSQFYANPLYLNPAMAGTAVCPRVNMNYRNHYSSLNMAYTTYAVSYDQYADLYHGGIGIHLMNDMQSDGSLYNINGDIIYAYSMELGKKFWLQTGFQVSYMQRFVQWDKLIFPDMIDPTRGVVYETKEIRNDELKNFLDFSTGIVGYGRNYYFGLAVHHLNQLEGLQQNEGYKFLPQKYTVNFGAKIPLFRNGLRKERLSLLPNIIYQKQQNAEQINFGFYLARKLLLLGVWLRHDLNLHYDSYTILLGFSFEKLKLSYSYDFSMLQLGPASYGGHEAAIIFQFNCPDKSNKRKYKPISCPTF